MNYLVIGDGPAGQTAAEAILKLEPSASVDLFTEENLPFYSRIKLVEYLDGRVDREGLVIRKAPWFEEKGVRLHLGEAVTRLEPDARWVETTKGRYPFDRLLIATGGNPFLPPIPGIELAKIGPLRTIEDAERLKEWAREARSGVVIGGGILGLETAASLLALNPELALTVVDTSPYLLPRQLDATAGRILQRLLESKGLKFLIGAKTLRFEGATKLERVVTNRETLPADFAVICAGIRARVELAEAAGLRCGRGILVDSRMMTDREGIYAAGDVAEYEGRSYGIWKAAMDQGTLAGKNMAGQPTSYAGTVMSNKLKVSGIDLASVGNFDPEDHLEARRHQEGDSYTKIVLDQGVIIGGILLGDTSRYQALVNAVAARKPIEEWA